MRLAHSWRSWVRCSRRCATSCGQQLVLVTAVPLRGGRRDDVLARAVGSWSRHHSVRHFVIVTVVPRPTSETIANSSISRRAPGRPSPSPW